MFGENYEALSYSEQYEVSARLLANPSLPSHKRRNMHPAVLSTMGGGEGGLPADYNIHDLIYCSVNTLEQRNRDTDNVVTLCTLKLDGGWFLQ